MPTIKLVETHEGKTISLGDLIVNLTELRRRAALVGKGTKDVPIARRRPGQGQMRWKDGSYLSVDEATDEAYQKEMDIA